MTLISAAGVSPAEGETASVTTRLNGRAVRELRERRGWGSKRLASTAGIDYRYLSKLENGHKHGSPETRYNLAKALDVDLSAITYQVPRTRRRRSA